MDLAWPLVTLCAVAAAWDGYRRQLHARSLEVQDAHVLALETKLQLQGEEHAQAMQRLDALEGQCRDLMLANGLTRGGRA